MKSLDKGLAVMTPPLAPIFVSSIHAVKGDIHYCFWRIHAVKGDIHHCFWRRGPFKGTRAKYVAKNNSECPLCGRTPHPPLRQDAAPAFCADGRVRGIVHDLLGHLAGIVDAVGGVAVGVDVLGLLLGRVVRPALRAEGGMPRVVEDLERHVAHAVEAADCGVAVRIHGKRLVAREVVLPELRADCCVPGIVDLILPSQAFLAQSPLSAWTPTTPTPPHFRACAPPCRYAKRRLSRPSQGPNSLEHVAFGLYNDAISKDLGN